LDSGWNRARVETVTAERGPQAVDLPRPPVFRILGPLEVSGVDPAALGGPRQKAVLIDLLLHANEVLPGPRLINDLWEGEPSPGAATTLKVYVSHLRQALAKAATGAVLATRRPGYVLEVDPLAIDAGLFESLVVEHARLVTADPGAATAGLDRALALWRGTPLAEVADLAFARPDVTRLEELRLTALESRLEADLLLGRHAEVTGELQALVDTHPYHEGFWALLMRSLQATGRRADALRAYQRLRAVLGEGLGIEPSLALQQLEQTILLEDLQPAASSAKESNLPIPGTSFVGRSEELRELEALLEDHRLITMVGEGGSGKTRLATEVARRLAPNARRGPWLVELATATTADQAARLAANAVGAREVPGRPPLDGVIEMIGDDDVLVVLDNCEHLLDPIALAVTEVLGHCPNLHLLATSREGLQLPEELQWRIPPLATPPSDTELSAAAVARYDSVKLLVDRAETADPLFSLTDDRVAAVCTICRRLDGMPLALELAAARLRVLSLEEVAARLDDRFQLLATGRHGVPRQRSLEAAVEWSYDLLQPPERMLFQRLSVFAGLFSLEHVEAVCVGSGIEPREVVDLLGNLVAKSLLVRLPRASGAARFRMLETLRQYAAERLGDGAEAHAVRAKHAAWYLSRSEEASAKRFGQGWRRWMDRFEEEHDDCRAALRWLLDLGDTDLALRLATALWRFWDYHFLNAEGRAWLDRALALAGGSDDLRRRALAGSAYLSMMDDDLDAAFARCSEGLRLAGTDEDPGGHAALLLIQAEANRNGNRSAEEAARLSADAAELFHRAGDEWGEADALRVRTLLAIDRRDLTNAFAFGERCLLLWDRCGDIEGSAGARSLLAGLALDTGDLEQAETLYEKSLIQFRQAGEPWGTAQMTWSLGRVSLLRGSYDRAYQFGQECRAMCQQIGNRRGTAQASQLMGDAALELGRIDEADERCTEALAQFRARDFEPDTRKALVSAAAVALAMDDAPRAASLAQQAGADPSALVLLARAQIRLGDYDAARGALGAADEALGDGQLLVPRAWAIETAVELDLVAGDGAPGVQGVQGGQGVHGVQGDDGEDVDVRLDESLALRGQAGVALAPSERSYRDRLFLLAHQVGGGREEGVVIDLRDRVPQHPAPEPITPFGGIGPPD
jgi:predicted ATPase/DNA-binding SARP family transcriptional activator